MAESAFQTLYRKETIAGFEQGQSLLRATVTTETMSTGNQTYFLVADSGGTEPVTRGINGRIQGQPDNLTQIPVALTEWHDKREATNFNIFASQGDRNAIMQKNSLSSMNRKVDQDIIGALNTGTVNTGATQTADKTLVNKAYVKLQNAAVPWDSNITGLITPAFLAYLSDIDDFASADFVEMKPLPGMEGAWNDKPKVKHWMGVNWIMHPNLPGAETASEKCFMYHSSAVGHAMNTSDLKVKVGYNEEDDYSWALTSCFMGSAKIQNAGIVVMTHDGSAFA